MNQPNKYTVTEINNVLKDLILGVIPEKIIISGEISNLKIANSNLFLTLKDDESNINVVSWGYTKSKNKIELNNGDKVSITGKLALYTKSGTYNLTLHHIEKLGMGQLYNEYEILKQKCEKMGYFDINKKKQMPTNIKNIGIVTAPEGAALQDILYVLKNNNYSGKVIVKRSLVQGNMCAKSIVKAIDFLKSWQDEHNNKLDVILITRGGGSFEDLMGFSDIKVIESINKCDIFTISAVGHEIDFMLSDFTADLRAPTPSIAAERISEQQKKQTEKLNNDSLFYREYIKNLIMQRIETNICKLESFKSKIKNPIQSIELKIDYLNDLQRIINNTINIQVINKKNKLDQLGQKLEKYDLDNMLNSGYVLLLKRGKIYDSVKELEEGQKLKIKLKDGEVEIKVNKIYPKNEQ